MTIEPYTGAVLAILFFAALTRSTFGFGDALVAMPLLSLVPGVETAGFSKPLVALVIAATSGWIALRSHRAVEWTSAWRLLLAAAAGVPLGLYFLTRADERLVKGALGLLVILFSLYGLFQPQLPRLNEPEKGRIDRGTVLFGFLAGLLGGTFNTHGPPLAVYGTLRRWSAERFRATLQAYFFPASLLIVCGDGISGLWTAGMWQHFACSLPLLIVAMPLGRLLNSRFSAMRFQAALHFLLLGTGGLLLGTAIA